MQGGKTDWANCRDGARGMQKPLAVRDGSGSLGAFPTGKNGPERIQAFEVCLLGMALYKHQETTRKKLRKQYA